MSEDHQRDRDNNQEKKKTRRTRKDQQGRNFSCPCGKSYLSYPALYTHIKTKHYGKAPKQNVLAAQAEPQVEPQPQCLMNIKEMLQKNFPNDGIRFGVLLTTNEEAYIASIMSNQEESDKDRFEDIVNNKNQTINNIFGKFLCQMKKLVKGEAFVYLCQLIAQFQMLIVEEKKDQDYCRTNNGALLPYYFNDLISKKRVPAVKHFFEPNSNHLSVGCKVLYNFGVWLFEQKYSNFSIKYNTV